MWVPFPPAKGPAYLAGRSMKLGISAILLIVIVPGAASGQRAYGVPCTALVSIGVLDQERDDVGAHAADRRVLVLERDAGRPGGRKQDVADGVVVGQHELLAQAVVAHDRAGPVRQGRREDLR